MSLDLDAYFARIGYAGPRTPSFATLAEIQRRHICAIPFENLDVLLGRPIQLDLAAIEQKLVHQRRGGYCFEQNALLRAALTGLGFPVRSLIARVRWQVPADTDTAKTHMVLSVDVEGRPHLVDGGFGSASLGAPLALDNEGEQPTPYEPRRVIERAGLKVQQIKVADEWADLYVFDQRPALAVDYEAANWFTSTFPQSRFVQNLVCARAFDGGRFTLLNREFTTRWIDGRVEKRELTTPDELLDVLADAFTLRFPPGTRFGTPGSAWPS
ncbi:MAG TPA: arylamine N-acetyltransferase [Opitutus sp.]|nr:arylamine N-acetyltransferase [Opitutus sp.]